MISTIFSFALDFLAQGLVVVYPSVLIFWLIIHSNIDRWRSLGRRSYWIAATGLPVFGGSVLLFRERIFSIQWQPGLVFQAIGAIAFIASLTIGYIAGQMIPTRTLVGLAELEPHKATQPLLQRGIYARTRNPIYLAHWLLILSMAALTGYAANWLLFVVDCAILPFMIRAEQKELRMRYGAEFEDYARRVPRFFPKLT
ncbi:MAG: isoprenylcysteine carboxylmethyltransferase family protein [Acidobacteria bacterium]|nr:isoprenylcysteine carboxylmethyltransferase family protein [Acidobacteriota bacterium]